VGPAARRDHRAASRRAAARRVPERTRRDGIIAWWSPLGNSARGDSRERELDDVGQFGIAPDPTRLLEAPSLRPRQHALEVRLEER